MLPNFFHTQHLTITLIAKTQSALDIWVAFLTRHDLLKVDSLPKELDSEELRKALTVLDVLYFNEESESSLKITLNF